MASRQNELRITRGLIRRLTAFCPSASASNDAAAGSIAAKVYASKRAPKARGKQNHDPLDVQLINLGLRLKSQSDQSRVFDIAPDKSIMEVLRILTIGEQFTNRADSRITDELHDIDYSLIAPSDLVELVEAPNSGLAKLIQKNIDDHMLSLGFAAPRDCAALSQSLEAFIPRTQLQSIIEISDAFYSLKQVAWPLFGSDLLTFLQGLADPYAKFSDAQLGVLFGLTKCWRLDGISARLLILRAINNHQERSFVEQQSAAIYKAANFTSKTLCCKTVTAETEPEFILAYQSISDPIETALLFSRLFYWYLDRREYNKVLALINSQYERDPTALAFLNWNEFHAKMAKSWGQNYLLNLLLSVTLLSPYIASRFECIEFSYGEGFIANQLLNFVHSLKSSPLAISQFSSQIATLGPKARSVVATFVLHKSIVEIYANEFPKASLFRRLRTAVSDQRGKLPLVDLVVCNTRLRLASLFRDKKVLPAEYCDRIIQEEFAFRKMLRFQEVFRNSRIRIDWKSLENEISAVIEEDFGFFFKRTAAKKDELNSSVADIVATMIGERVCDLSLFESTTCLERALSNNLRHGVVIPRFLKAFIETISKHSHFPSPTDGKNRVWYNAAFPRAANRLFQLEEDIINLVTEYQEERLRVERPGAFYRQLVQRISSGILKSVSKGSGFTIKDIVADIIDILKQSFSSVLAESREKLKEEVKSKIEKMVSLASIDIRELDEKGSGDFIDTLSISLGAAMDEVGRWISLYDSEVSNAFSFDIKDLINEEANSLLVSDRSKASIKFEYSERVGPRLLKVKEAKASGRAFELFDQIIHNCLSNALGKSGLGRDTKVQIRITNEPDFVTVWFSNTFAPGRMSEMQLNQTKAKKIIAAAVKAREQKGPRKKRPNSHKEGGYGLMKIIDACEHVCGALPQFNFPIISESRSQFIVEIKIPNPSAIFA